MLILLILIYISLVRVSIVIWLNQFKFGLLFELIASKPFLNFVFYDFKLKTGLSQTHKIFCFFYNRGWIFFKYVLWFFHWSTITVCLPYLLHLILFFLNNYFQFKFWAYVIPLSVSPRLNSPSFTYRNHKLILRTCRDTNIYTMGRPVYIPLKKNHFITMGRG